MDEKNINAIFSLDALKKIFPEDRADQFFEALYGEVEEGAYTIGLKFTGVNSERKTLLFELELQERPGKCLACNLTYGLPEVFSRHPIINIKGLVKEIEGLLGDGLQCTQWSLGRTLEVSKKVHSIPLTIKVEEKEALSLS